MRSRRFLLTERFGPKPMVLLGRVLRVLGFLLLGMAAGLRSGRQGRARRCRVTPGGTRYAVD
ncbi:hypothetical protein H0B56_05005 [Haloechinothrix sp. YIM 98757]|uniref:Uncharacterized protein n=1 Tax=Haloechinothrix aidingensis TaxID=2752311 RepID=A0A838A765_9PSEU|nr:hypothetical protein [Haloechinothrix aidingensis]MBA0124895.1 hypothetical protein [Haloechinothrix aidingensis]